MALLNEYHKPATLAEALQLLSRTETRLVPLAGGSRLIGELETRARRDVDGVVDLSGLGLSYIHAEDNELRVGAMTTISDLIAHPVARTHRRSSAPRRPLRRTDQCATPPIMAGIVAAAEADS
ncbi:MAG: FAD binding domain-containing protein [Caldilineaceae bacterium]